MDGQNERETDIRVDRKWKIMTDGQDIRQKRQTYQFFRKKKKDRIKKKPNWFNTENVGTVAQGQYYATRTE